MRAALPVTALAGLLAACATAPKVEPPQAAPAAWVEAGAPATAPEESWWVVATSDATLQGILSAAGAVDDVRAAQARQAEAEALLRAARASLFPTLGISGTGTALATQGAVGSASSQASASLTAPIDIFGALRKRSQAAAARAIAAEAETASARINARRTAGQLYAALRTAQAQRAAAQRLATSTADSLSLAQTRAAAGIEGGLAVAQAQAAADAAQARIPGFAQAETQARLGLEALLGLAPGALRATLVDAPQSVIDARALMDRPASVLARRPDVLSAQARLRASGLDAAAAGADRWPTVSLTGLLTRTDASGRANPISGPDATTASAGLSAALTLFDFGRLEALAEAAGARAQADAATYRATVSQALSEVEQQANRAAQADIEAQAARAAVASARDQAALARARYTSGLSSFLDVLLAERTVGDAEIALASAEGRSADANVQLAAALGLGKTP